MCPGHGEVGSDGIVGRYEYSSDRYVIIQPEELDKARSESDKSINIDGFIDAKKLDLIYQSGKTYDLFNLQAAGNTRCLRPASHTTLSYSAEKKA